jgi:hypothetical protein
MFIIFSHLPYRLILQPPSQVKEGVQQLVTLQNPHVAPQAPCKSSESMGIYGLYGDFWLSSSKQDIAIEDFQPMN